MSRYMRGAMAALLWLGISLAAHAQTTVEYIHTDALGTPIAVTDANKVVIETTEYEPYGAQVAGPVKDGPGYTGHVQDVATGLTYMQQRYYDPQAGLFLSVDPVDAYGSPVASFHRYRYANNSPYRFVDPDGRGSDEPERAQRDTRSLSARCLSCAGAATTTITVSQGTTQWMQPANWNSNVSQPLRQQYGSLYDDSTAAGESAAMHWAGLHNSTGNAAYAVPGAFASLWTPQTAPKTSVVLSIGSGLGAWAGRPYWQYYPASNPGYSSTWMTRGRGWEPPYALGAEARGALALPHYNSATAVRAVYPSGYVRGPRSVKPQPEWGHMSPTGTEYRTVPWGAK